LHDKSHINVLILSSTIVAIGCVVFLAKETRYLLSATDRATQEEVQQYLGQPSRMTTNETGEAVWTYHIREFVQGGNNAWTMAGTWWCYNYTLTFDAHGILRHWMHESHKCNATLSQKGRFYVVYVERKGQQTASACSETRIDITSTG
jgi:hypothetical protein